MSTRPPHKKLQNDVAGIDAEFGSIYVIPAPGDFVDEEEEKSSKGNSAVPAHQLVNFGPNQEKLLIIPDYRVHHVVPGVAVKPLISSDKMVKTDDPKKKNKDNSQDSAKKEGEEAEVDGNTTANGDANAQSSDKNSSSAPGAQSASTVSSSASSQTKQGVKVFSQRKDFVELLSSEFQEKLATVAPSSPITSLAKLTGPDGVILLDMFEGMGVATLEHLASFPTLNEEGVQLLKEADMFIDVVEYCANVAALLQLSPPIGPQDFLSSGKTGLSKSSAILVESRNSASPSPSPTDGTKNSAASSNSQAGKGLSSAASKRVNEVPGIDDETCAMLYKYALINTALDLVNFPVRFSGIYRMMKLTGQIPNIDELVASAAAMCGINAPSTSSQAPIGAKSNGTADISASTHLGHLGEKQSSNVPIKDVSSNTLLGVLDGMSVELANVLAVQLPAVTSLSSLATFAEVSPSEYSYLLRQYPELADLSQQAALLVSIASGRATSKK